jgi:lysophospholipase L1-like esterase
MKLLITGGTWCFFLLGEFLLLSLAAVNVNAQYLGVTCGFNYNNELKGPYSAAGNTPLYNPQSSNPNATWNEWAAQLKQSGVDYVCPNLRGSQPNTSVSPTNIASFVTALNNQGNVTKLAIFDDNASSWTAQWNQANGRGFGYAQKFDMSDTNNWKYIYDYNYKLFYQTVPDTNRFKINGRPLIIIWTGNTVTFLTNVQGNASRALNYVRQQCQADFGFNPYIVLSGDFFSNDTTCTNAGVADGEEGWFSPPNSAFSLRTRNGAKIGALCPQFQDVGNGNFIDPNHGITLDNALSSTVGAGALLTLCEGFSDWPEDAALLRVRNLDASGNALTYSQTYYDYPNQRINILRKHSQNPFPTNLTLEAEGCDTYGGANGGNGQVNFYRNGNIAIETTTDSGGGWDVGWIQSGEWFEWQGVPLNGRPHFLVRVASPNSGCTGHFVIDGVAQPSQTLPNTGSFQTWVTYDFGPYGTYINSYHTVRFVSDNGGIDFNWWQMVPTAADGSLGDANIKYFGRWDFSGSTQYVSYWGGAYLKVNFSGTTVQMKLNHASNYYVKIDNGSWTTFNNVNGTVNLTPTPLANGIHTLSVAQGKDYDYVFNFQGLILDAGATTSLPTVSTNLVEFVGDSITAGYTCAQADVSDYAWVCSENLGVEHTQIAYPGQNLVSGYSGTGMDVQYFKMQSFNYPSSPDWNFTDYTAKLVVINLGQNDIGANGVPLAIFQSDYTNFMFNIRAKYPNAHIFAMRTFAGFGAAQTQAAVAARNATGDSKVHFIDTTGWLGSYPGPDWNDGVHPSVAGHIKVASQLQPILDSYISGNGPTNIVAITTSTAEGSGTNWLGPNFWSSGLTPGAGNFYEALSGAVLRPPQTGSTAGSPIVFAGDALQIDSGANIRLKSSGAPNAGFFTFSGMGSALILNGGSLANGDDFAATINSPINLIANSAIYAAVDAVSPNDQSNAASRRGFRNYIFNGGLAGIGNLILGNAIMYNNPLVTVSVGVTPNFAFVTNSAYSGNITVTAGWLQAGAQGALGTGNLTIAGGNASNGVNGPAQFNATVAYSNLTATLTIQNTNSILLLNTNLTFGGAVIDGITLANGIYTAAQINGATMKANVVDPTGKNILNVGGVAVTPVLYPQLTGSNLVLNWTNAGAAMLQSATNVAGPWMPVPGAVSPYTNIVLSEVPTMFFKLK